MSDVNIHESYELGSREKVYAYQPDSWERVKVHAYQPDSWDKTIRVVSPYKPLDRDVIVVGKTCSTASTGSTHIRLMRDKIEAAVCNLTDSIDVSLHVRGGVAVLRGTRMPLSSVFSELA